MFESFFYSVQDDIKFFLLFPLLAAVFRTIFIFVYSPYPSLKGRWKTVFECYRYGFWWGMDYNAYMFLIPFLLVSVPSLFISNYADTFGDSIRIIIGALYALILYVAFMGKMIFYHHFHDIFNYLIHMGKNAEKNNLIDVFFNEDHGFFILLMIIPYLIFIIFTIHSINFIPYLPYYQFANVWVQYICNGMFFLGCILAFYWVRYGGTFMHDDKPEWDTIPSIVKEDIFFARACPDDLVALKEVRKKPISESAGLPEEVLEKSITSLMPAEMRNHWKELKNPLYAFKREAVGAKIKKPKHIFLIVGESVPQWAVEPLFEDIHVIDRTRFFMKEKDSIAFTHALPAGNISRPSIVSLLTGVYDAQLELNEKEIFWNVQFTTSLARQIKRLGYRTLYWYGGNASYGNFNKFGTAQGFDEVISATNICGPDAPKTWVGVYDDVFLKKVAEMIVDLDEPTFHFIYTTSNHGPYKIPDSVTKFNPEKQLANVPEDVRHDKGRCKALGAAYYADQAVHNFIDSVKEKFPDSLIVYTGDHSAQYGNLSGTEFLPRDLTIREQYCTPIIFNHPELKECEWNNLGIATHMHIMPTLIELIADKGFSYYSLYRSLTDTNESLLATPKQWISEDFIGDSEHALMEPLGISMIEGTKKELVKNHEGLQKSQEYLHLTEWFLRHGKDCLEEI